VTLPIDPEEALIVVGALATKPADRNVERHEVHPVQVLTDEGFQPVRALDRASSTRRRATTSSASTSRRAPSPTSGSS
jgi:hypothetical protein